MRGFPRLPFLSHMPFPALARGETWLLLEEPGVPFVGAARGSGCRGDSALHSSWSKAVSQQPERSTEMNSLFSNYCYFGRLFWRVCNWSPLGWLWLTPASPAELCCPATAFSAFVRTLFLANFLWRCFKLGLSRQWKRQWRDLCVHPSFLAPWDLWLPQAVQVIEMLFWNSHPDGRVSQGDVKTHIVLNRMRCLLTKQMTSLG